MERFAVMLGFHAADPRARRIFVFDDNPGAALRTARSERESAKIWYALVIEGRRIVDERLCP